VGVDVDLGVVAAVPAGEIKSAHAVATHVGKRHGADRFVKAGHVEHFIPDGDVPEPALDGDGARHPFVGVFVPARP